MDGALTSESLVQGDGMRNAGRSSAVWAGPPPPPRCVWLQGAASSLTLRPAPRMAELLVWMGDFNYRIDGCYEDVKERAVRGDLAPLAQLVRRGKDECKVPPAAPRCKPSTWACTNLQDQCKREMAAGRVFRGLREGPLTFRPTYKFDKNSLNPFGYDSSEVGGWVDARNRERCGVCALARQTTRWHAVFLCAEAPHPFLVRPRLLPRHRAVRVARGAQRAAVSCLACALIEAWSWRLC